MESFIVIFFITVFIAWLLSKLFSTAGATPTNGELTSAAKRGALEEVRKLIEAGTNIDEKDAAGYTPLWVAAHNGHQPVVQFLIEAGAGKDAPKKDGATPLYAAAHKGHVEVVQALLEAGADKDAPVPGGATPLYAAAHNGHVEVVQALLEAGADKDAPEEDGATPLWMAAHKGHVEVVQALLEAGADKDAPEEGGSTPLWVAAHNGHVEVVQALLEAGADKDAPNKDGATPLWMAAQNGHVEVVQALLEVGADKDAPEEGGYTPLWVAAREGHVEVVQVLVDAGADKDAPNMDGATPLYIAAKNGHRPVVQALVEAGADKDAPNKDGVTPLIIAAQQGHIPVVRALVEAGADVTAKSKEGDTAQDVAKGEAVATLLREAPAIRAAAVKAAADKAAAAAVAKQKADERKAAAAERAAAAEAEARQQRLLESSASRVDFATSLTVEALPIAAGSFKSVFRAKWHRAGDSAAVTVALLKVRGLGHVELEREVQVFVTLGKHPHLAKLLGVTTHPDGEACMLVEYAPYGSLDKVLSDAVDQETQPSEVVRITVALQICEAMAQLVEHGVVHRDLASRNVLVFRFSPWDRTEVVVKVTDYGQALLGAGGSRGVTTHSGETARPVRWLSPEALRQHVYSQASDAWAFGVTLWELESGAAIPYWEEGSDTAVAERVVAGRNLLGRPDGCSDAVWRVMQKCWKPVAKERPAFSSLKMLLQDALGEATARAVAGASPAPHEEMCVVCWDAQPVMAFLPCGHKCVCAECLPRLIASSTFQCPATCFDRGRHTGHCPVCSKSVQGSVRVFGT